MKIVTFIINNSGMQKIQILLYILFTFTSVTAQNENNIIRTIKGRVINEITNEAVSFTNISIEGTFYGTAGDEVGNFELKIPEEMLNEKISFSAVGYKQVNFPVTFLLARDHNIIKMEPTTYDIENVDIAAQSKVLIRILRMASESTPYNFLGGPFNLICKYENEKIIEDTILIARDAEVTIYDETGYKTPSKINAFRKLNYKINKSEPDYRFASGITNFDELLDLDWVRSGSSVLNPAIINSFQLVMEEETESESGAAWVIAFSQKTPTPEGSDDFHATYFRGRITILKDDYSVKRIEGSGTSKRHNRQGKSLAADAGDPDHFDDVTYDFSITYSQLKPDEFYIQKKYTHQGEQVKEISRLKVNSVQMSNLQKIGERDYFAE